MPIRKTVWRLMGAIDSDAIGCPACGANYGPKKAHFCSAFNEIIMWDIERG